MMLMGSLTRLLGGLQHQDPFSLTEEIKAILLLEVEVVKVHKEIKQLIVFIYRLSVRGTQRWFSLRSFETLFRLSGVPLKLCRFILGCAIIFLSVRSFQGNLSLFEITRAFFVHFPKTLGLISFPLNLS